MESHNSIHFLKDEKFAQIQSALDNNMKKLCKAGIGATTKQAQIITFAEENILWERNVLGIDNPEKLLHTVFYMIGLNFALRGGDEHRSLRHGTTSQIQLEELATGGKVLIYREEYSKCHQGGLKDLNTKKKVVKVYENENKDRCPVHIYQVYLSHCPLPLDDLPGFYLRPLASPTSDVWYYRAPLGRHKLGGIIKEICGKAEIGGYRSDSLV